MNQLWIAFLTGLTTGGLSCVALQGGLLASVILDEEKEYLEDKKSKPAPKARPVILFLIAKLVAYTILGFLLGFFGSFISLSPAVRGWLQILIGIFMVGLALNILNVHPIFRYFSIQPPKFIRKFVRKQTKNSGDLGAIFMGALTVLLPCAITQAMMLLAISSGSGISGAAIMFSFVLGTSPLFFILGYTASTLTEKWSAIFQKVVAVLVLFVAVFTILTGTTLAGISLSLKNDDSSVAPCQGSNCPTSEGGNSSDSSAQTVNGVQEVTINLTDNGYQPDSIKLKKGVPTKVTLKTSGTLGCIRAFVVPSLNIQKVLPKTGTDSFEFTPDKTGTINFTCSMGMYKGEFVVE
ncbi:MAG: sulfite exporter TauE/SafE family protein [bacterium]|nr:sulfite exporter TauE/SafE family protein [bacterium]